MVNQLRPGFHLSTLRRFVSRKSCICLPAVAGHSYENCRVTSLKTSFGSRLWAAAHSKLCHPMRVV